VHRQRLHETQPRRDGPSDIDDEEQQLSDEQAADQRDDTAPGRVAEHRKRHVDAELERERRQRDGATDEREVSADLVDPERVDPLGVVATERRADDDGAIVAQSVRVVVVGAVVNWDVDGTVGQKTVLR